MDALFWLPEEPFGTVLIAHAGIGGRLASPNDYVGSILRSARFATLCVDLLQPQEAGGCMDRFDAAVLAQRLGAACDWLSLEEATRDLPLGLFGTGHASAAALRCAASRGRGISGLVTRGGRPELAGQHALSKVSAPTMLIVGGLDELAVRMHRVACAALHCRKRLEIIPGATPLFDEPGNLEVVARLARGWFQAHSRFKAGFLPA